MKLHRLSLLAGIAFLLGAWGQAPAQADKWLPYEPAVVELTGKLTMVTKYGPPNYGENPETDEKVKVPVLLLSRPVNVRGQPGDELNSESVRGIKEIQLVLEKLSASYRMLANQQVRVKGTLFHAHTGHHYTAALMTVRQIKKNGKTGE
jgi:hypothetical protein